MENELVNAPNMDATQREKLMNNIQM